MQSFDSVRDFVKFPFPTTIAVAHRGAHGELRPQNSLAAVQAALAAGSPGIEIDVSALGDGSLIATHDQTVRVDRTRVPLSALRPAEARARFPDRFPPVEPLLEAVARSRAFLCLDWKGLGNERAIGELVRSFGLVERTIVSSTSAAAVASVKQADPEVSTGLSLTAYRMPPADAVARLVADTGADAAMIEHAGCSAETVATLRRNGLGVFLWTARDSAMFRLLLELEPDGIMSDAIEDVLSVEIAV
jgi:glycerophosphoryl diester phosphodiesterase